MEYNTASSSSNVSSSTSSTPWDFYSAFSTYLAIWFYTSTTHLTNFSTRSRTQINGVLYPCYYAATRVSHSWGGWGINFNPCWPHYALLMRKNVHLLHQHLLLSERSEFLIATSKKKVCACVRLILVLVRYVLCTWYLVPDTYVPGISRQKWGGVQKGSVNDLC